MSTEVGSPNAPDAQGFGVPILNAVHCLMQVDAGGYCELTPHVDFLL
jgi:hypothetical protein